ncbi:MAG: 3-hydroxyacyl-CoA dehydrogenase NAD-binding domain-containing protein [Desulfobacteraceae bacterium]
MGIDRIAIIGAGIVGAGIGQAATSNGYMVILEDIEPSAWIRQLGR